MDSILFTPAALIDLLSKIDELADTDIGITETIDGQLQLTVGESTYGIDTSDATTINVDEQTVDQVEDVNMSAYESLDETIDVSSPETVESGILKEIAKSLLLGGMIRLSSKLIK